MIEHVLFLDFDGVLHPEKGASSRFKSNELLWDVLRDFPSLQVVFSTSWRTVYPESALTCFVTQNGGEDLEHRFIGVTPVIYGADREEECLAWLQENPAHFWLALDDVSEWFPNTQAHLFWVNPLTGLTENDTHALAAKLAVRKAD